MEVIDENRTENKIKKEQEISVFIVDDDQSYLYALGFHLKKDTMCKVYCYQTGEDCLENIHLNPSIIILDYFLNSGKKYAKNGLNILKKIKKLRPETYVVMLSGQENLQIATNSLKFGAFTYIIKDTLALSSIRHIVNLLSNEKTDYLI